MFTGIITHIGILEKREGSRYTFKTDVDFCQKLTLGTSVSVNGACLTVSEKPSEKTFGIELMPETVRKTMFADLKLNKEVNLELPVSVNSLFSGHIVQGHTDTVGEVENIQKEKNSRIITIKVPKHLSRYIIEKGSIAVNGISLTVIAVGETFFTVGIIPYTWEHTMLHEVCLHDKVNIEVDMLAKYVEKLLVKK